MKTIYWFKPANHWNVVSFEVYEVLQKFYGTDYFHWERLKVTYEETK